jgi:hypothetical protein
MSKGAMMIQNQGKNQTIAPWKTEKNALLGTRCSSSVTVVPHPNALVIVIPTFTKDIFWILLTNNSPIVPRHGSARDRVEVIDLEC